MNEKKLVPRRRFEEFQNADAWELRKLSELGEVTTGKAFSSADFNEEGEYLVITNKDISDSPRSQNTLTDRIDTSDDKLIDQYKLNGENILVTMDGVNLGKTGMYSNDKALLAQRVGRIQSDQIKFVYQVTINSAFLSMMRTLSVGNAIKHISLKQIANYTTFVPTNNEEQIMIGSFFANLDETITLHQRKLEKTKALKSAYLAEMFPAEGERVPKRRFAGFTDEWEEWKLDDVAIYRRGSFPQPYGKREWYDEVNGMPFVQVVDVGKNLKLVDNTKQKISKLAQPNSIFVEKGKILVTLQGSIGRVAITQYPSYIDRTLLLFESYKLPIDTIYFAYIIQRLFEIEKLKAPGGTIKTITKEALNAFIVLLPNVKEQIAIGKFFKKLDESINNQQQKLNKLKAMKQAYLQEMFV